MFEALGHYCRVQPEISTHLLASISSLTLQLAKHISGDQEIGYTLIKRGMLDTFLTEIKGYITMDLTQNTV